MVAIHSEIDAANITENEPSCGIPLCNDTHILAHWIPDDPRGIAVGYRVGLVIILLCLLMYIFLGLSMVSDKFYGAIDTIVSKKKRVKVISRLTGSSQYVLIPIWNETVAHLTLFVVGTSAPEILLSIIEVIIGRFKIGELAPMVILGSAFNLFITAGVCVVSVKGKAKKLEDLKIFFVTAFFAVFSYIWLYLIIVPFSDGAIEPWEAILTLSFYPIMVVVAYIVNKEFFGIFRRCKKHNRTAASGAVTPDNSLMELGDDLTEGHVEMHDLNEIDEVEAAKLAAEQRQSRFLKIMKEMRAKYPNKTSAQIQSMAEMEIIKEMPKSMGYYRMLASKGFSGGGEVINKEKLRLKFENSDKNRFEKPNQQIISFDPPEYKVMEDCGSFEVNVIREGRYLENAVSVEYATEDDSGVAGSDYETIQGKLVFSPGETLKHINITIIDDEVFNLDTQFYINLSNPEVIDPGTISRKNPFPEIKLESAKAKVTKIDDDHGGLFHFDKPTITFEEDVGEAIIKIQRSSGAKACVAVPYKIIPETAKVGLHYEEPKTKFVAIFPNRTTEQSLKLTLLNEERLAKNVTLRIELGQPYFTEPIKNEKDNNKKQDPKKKGSSTDRENDEPSSEQIDTSNLGKPKLGENSSLLVSITENLRLKRTVENLASIDLNELVGSTSWKQQFVEAVTVVASSGNNNENDEDNPLDYTDNNEADEKNAAKPSCKDYAFHILTFFWKLLFACIPPSGVWGGWAGFLCCLVIIGAMMAIAGDIAVLLGCTIGMKTQLTAITFIALGVSLPDMFASRLAAMREETADSAIGHMSGRIGVSIFLGFGLSWSIAAIYQSSMGHVLEVEVKSLTFTIILFFVFAAIVTFILLLRRFPPIRGELGGPFIPRILTGILFVILWIVYVVLSALDSECLISTKL